MKKLINFDLEDKLLDKMIQPYRFTFTDIIKDVSEIHKNICKIHKYKSYVQKIIG